MKYSWLKHMKETKRKQQKQQGKTNSTDEQSASGLGPDYEHAEDFSTEIFTSIDKNIENFNNMLGSPSDFTTRKISIGENAILGAILFIDGLVDKTIIHDIILENLQFKTDQLHSKAQSTDQVVDMLKEQFLAVSEVEKSSDIDKISLAILSGDTALFLEGTSSVLIIGSKGGDKRSIEEPMTEALIRGPREGFVENIRTNTMLIRRAIRDPNLRFDSYKVGRRAKRDIIVAYISGIAHPDLVKEVERRLKTIDIDSAPESGFIEQWIEDSYLSPFPQIQHTERPDRITSSLMQGKVAIILEGTPFVITVPFTFADTLQSPEDYYERWHIGSFVRVLRYLSGFISVFLPSLYIALVSYHQGMIPSNLAFSIAATREGVPFPAFVEAIVMAITMELLQEAGVRLPKPIGQTIGIVGGLVIGEAAVSAGIVSPIMVIVVAITAIASFTLPSYSVAITFRLLRFVFMIAAAIFGLFGVILCYIMINIHIVNLKSFGIPYATPFAPSFLSDWKDLVLRAPLTMMKNRPSYLQIEDQNRTDKGGERT